MSHPGRLLIAEDTEENRLLLSRQLTKLKLDVTLTTNGKECLQAAREQPFDLILLDLMMPDMNGYEVLKKLKADPGLKHIPVLMISAMDEIDLVVKCIEAGAEDYLSKPLEPVLLGTCVNACLEKKFLRDQQIALLEEAERQRAIAQAERMKLAGELAEAARYVRSMLPLPIKEGEIRTQWQFFPSVHLGGDSFGYRWLDPDHFAFYVLDVCGHGIKAALLSISVSNAMNSSNLLNVDFRKPAEVLGALNTAFAMEKHALQFFTMWYGVYSKSERTVTYTSAGHPAALLLNKNDTNVQRLTNSGPSVGIIPGAKFATATHELKPGSTLYLLSDGVYEIENQSESMMCLDDFVKVVPLFRETGIEDSEFVLRTIQDYWNGKEFEDDFCMLQLTFD